MSLASKAQAAKNHQFVKDQTKIAGVRSDKELFAMNQALSECAVSRAAHARALATSRKRVQRVGAVCRPCVISRLLVNVDSRSHA